MMPEILIIFYNFLEWYSKYRYKPYIDCIRSQFKDTRYRLTIDWGDVTFYLDPDPHSEYVSGFGRPLNMYRSNTGQYPKEALEEQQKICIGDMNEEENIIQRINLIYDHTYEYTYEYEYILVPDHFEGIRVHVHL